MSKCKANIFVVLFFFSWFCMSQTKQNLVELSIILKNIEQKFDISFSYADKLVKTISIQPPNQDLNLDKTLDYLRANTNLQFTKLSERFYAVTQKDSLSKSATTYTLQRLDEITIQNYLTRGLSKHIDGKIEINPKNISILPGLVEPDILQTIQNLPGIFSVDERISNLNIRGGTNDQNLVLFEGIRMYQTGHFFGLISAFNPYLTNEINVTVNGTSAKYGSGVSSLISINNSDTIASTPEYGIGTNLLSIDGFSRIPFSKKMELQLSARRSFTDVFSTPTYDAYFNRIFNNSELGAIESNQNDLRQTEQFYFYDVNAKFLYDFNEDSKLRVNFVNFYNKLEYEENSFDGNTLQEGSKSRLSQKSYAGNISYTKQWNSSTKTNAQIYYSNYTLLGNNIINTTTQELTQENQVDDMGIRFNIEKAVDKNLNINAGYQFNEVGVTNFEDVSIPPFRSFIKEVIKTHAIFGEAEFTSASKSTYGRIGLRGNYIEKFGEILFEPRVSFSQKFLDHFRIEVMGEIKSQTITQIIDLQQDFFGVEKRRWQLADNNEVPITKSNQFSLGMNYKNKGWLLSAEVYTKRVIDITSRTQGFQNQFQFVNAIGNYSVNGIDILVNKQFKNFSTWLSYSFSKNDFEFEQLNSGNPFPNNLDIRHVVNFSLAYELNRFKVASAVNWHSGRPFTEPSPIQNNPNSITYNAPNAMRIPSYVRVDLSARYSFPVTDKTNAEFGASIWNILNRKNTINRFFTQDNSGNIIENNNKALEFTPNFSFRLNF